MSEALLVLVGGLVLVWLLDRVQLPWPRAWDKRELRPPEEPVQPAPRAGGRRA